MLQVILLVCNVYFRIIFCFLFVLCLFCVCCNCNLFYFVLSFFGFLKFIVCIVFKIDLLISIFRVERKRTSLDRIRKHPFVNVKWIVLIFFTCLIFEFWISVFDFCVVFCALLFFCTFWYILFVLLDKHFCFLIYI